MLKSAIDKIINNKNLTWQEAYSAMNEVMQGRGTVIQNTAFLAAMSVKCVNKETIEEFAGCAASMREHATRVDMGTDVLEIAGTGGDGSSSFNISTTSAFIAAAAGVKVAKHGDRAASSQSGTADCLEALGANISLAPDACRQLLQETGFCFFYTQKYHPAIEYVGEIRKELGFRSIFNILGPLTNPANPSYYLLGVYDRNLTEPMARILVRLGVRKGLVVCGHDRMDEISLCAPTTVCEIRDGYFKPFVLTPEDYGFRRCSREQLVGGTPRVNAAITRSILDGSEEGPKRNVVLLNAGAAIYSANAAESIREGIEIAKHCIRDGSALQKMESFIGMSNDHPQF